MKPNTTNPTSVSPNSHFHITHPQRRHHNVLLLFFFFFCIILFYLCISQTSFPSLKWCFAALDAQMLPQHGYHPAVCCVSCGLHAEYWRLQTARILALLRHLFHPIVSAHVACGCQCLPHPSFVIFTLFSKEF